MSVILLLDADEEWSTNRSKIKETTEGLGLRNSSKELHGNNLPPTLPQSDKTLYYVLVSEVILGHIEDIGAATFVKESLEDHRGLYLDLNIVSLLNIGTVVEEMSVTRSLHYQSVKLVKKYLEIFEEKLKLYYQAL